MVKLGGMEANEKDLLHVKNLLIGACGTSYYASLYG
jgi:glucosamine--fructose-6-phosphate aminotransferase (isomerizing)